MLVEARGPKRGVCYKTRRSHLLSYNSSNDDDNNVHKFYRVSMTATNIDFCSLLYKCLQYVSKCHLPRNWRHLECWAKMEMR